MSRHKEWARDRSSLAKSCNFVVRTLKTDHSSAILEPRRLGKEGLKDTSHGTEKPPLTMLLIFATIPYLKLQTGARSYFGGTLRECIPAS